MSDATDAILDIQEALEEYGSSIVFNSIVLGPYDPVLGEAPKIITPHPTKALISDYTSKELENNDININDVKFRFYYNGIIDYSDNIIFGGKTYNLMNVDKKILQDENLIYTLQGRA